MANKRPDLPNVGQGARPVRHGWCVRGNSHPSPLRRVVVYGSKGESSLLPADQRNFGYFTYVSDDGTSYNIRCDSDWAAISGHGLAARANGQPLYITTGRRKPRSVSYTDLTTGRKKKGPVGTNSAYAALAFGATQDFHVEGETAAVSYTLSGKSPERVPGSVIATSLPDHA